MHHAGRRAYSYSDASPDFVLVAEDYGWTGPRISRADELEPAIKMMIETPGPVLVDCEMAMIEDCFPMVPAGAPHDELQLRPAVPPNAGAALLCAPIRLNSETTTAST